jgi:hypothetical protein
VGGRWFEPNGGSKLTFPPDFVRSLPLRLCRRKHEKYLCTGDGLRNLAGERLLDIYFKYLFYPEQMTHDRVMIVNVLCVSVS